MLVSSLLAAAAMVATSCPQQQHPASDVNRPIATARVIEALGPVRTEEAVRRFAKMRHFAVQEIIPAPQGMMEFATHLFRDDIRVSISKVRGEPIEIFAYPLCVCEADRRLGLQAAADAAVADLRAELLIR